MRNVAAMQLELPLLPYLDVGESARLVPQLIGAAGPPDRLTFRSSASDVLHVGADGELTGQAAGVATIAIEAVADGARASAMLDVRVLPPDAPRVSLRPEHPRIRYTAGELRQRRALLAAGRLPELGLDLRQRFQTMLERANTFAAEREFTLTYTIAEATFTPRHPLPIAQPTPLSQPRGFTDYPFWTLLSRTVETRLTTLTLAYSLTGQQRYAAKAREYLLALAGWRKWHEYDKATNNLSLPHFTVAAAIAYDELWALLTPEERAMVRESIVENGLRPMSHMFGLRRDHNIPTLLNIGMVVGYLAIGDELPHLAKFFNTPFADLQWYLEQRSAGETTEGLLYTAYALNNLLAVASQIRRATGNDELWQLAFLRTTLPELYLYFRGGQGGLANLSDAGYEDGSTPLLTHLTREYAHPIAAWLISHYQRDSDAPLLLLDRDVPVTPPAALGLPASKVFLPMGWAALRTGWDDDATLLAFTASGSAAGHNHFDQNAFILNVAGEWLLTDPGYQTYSPGAENLFTNATLGHNALLVNGEGQQRKGHAHITDQFLTPGFDYVAGDATGAYAGALTRWERRILHVKPDYFLVVDDVTPAASDDILELLFHTQRPLVLDGRPLNVGDSFARPDGEITIAGEHTSAGLRLLAPADANCVYEQYPGAERFGAYLRVRLPRAARQQTVTLLQPRSSSGAAPAYPVTAEATADGCWLTVERGDARDVWWLGQGAAASERVYRDELAGQARPWLVTRAAHTGAVRRLVLLHGTALTVGGQTLIATDQPIAADLAFAPAAMAGTLQLPSAGQVRLHVPWRPVVRVNGTLLPATAADYNPAQAEVAFALTAGAHAVVLARQAS
jgi:hypothetical protein